MLLFGFRAVRVILVANKADMKDLVQVTVYVTDMRAFHDIADIRTKYFPKDGPTSVIVEVSSLLCPNCKSKSPLSQPFESEL